MKTIPGFVDLQVNGFQGVDFSSPSLTEEDVVRACLELSERGTAAFLPTLITSPMQIYERNLPLIAKCISRPDLKQHLLGIHLEGPFLSREEGARGAHEPQWMLDADPDILDHLLSLACGAVRLITIAADITGAARLAAHASRRGVTVSLGHHMALDEDLGRCAAAGAASLTHLGNGTPLKIARHDNPIIAGIAADELRAMIITDGRHIPDSLIKTILRVKGVHNIIVTSDSSPLAGFPPGIYDSMNKKVRIHDDGRITVIETGYLAGSSFTLIDCMNYLASLRLLTVEGLIDAGVYNPLRLIGADQTLLTAVKPVKFDETAQRFTI